MKKLAVLAALLAGLASPVAAASIETYAQLPLIEMVSLSDDGSMIAIAMNDGLKHRVLVRPVASMDGAQFVELGENRTGGLLWRSNDELVIASVVDILFNGHQVIDRALRPHTFDLKTNKLDAPTPGRRVRTPPRWPYDENFHPVVEVSYEQSTGKTNFRYKNKVIASGVYPFGAPRMMAKGKAPDTVLFAMDSGTGPVARELELNTGAWSEPYDFPEDTRVFVSAEGELYGTVRGLGANEKAEFTRKEDQFVWDTLKKSFPKDQINIVTWSKDHRTVVVRLDGGGTPPAYVLVDIAAKKASFIANQFGGVGKADLAPVNPLTYKAADGLEIHGYLTTPAGTPAQNLPLVVLAHGGPAAYDNGSYDWWAQALASRGYAVLQSNFRGSTGYDAAFRLAGFGEFGRKMQTDLSDGVRHLVKEGVVDPKRVCIMGASYGGYAALAGAAFDMGVYRCAASYAGVSDLEQQIAPNGGKGQNSTGRYYAAYLGAKNAYDKILDDRSPAKHAENIDIPVLLVHGKDDLTVYYEQSQIMDRALRKAGKSVEFITLEGEDHQLSRGDTRQRMLTAMVAFLEKNNPPN